MAVSIKKDNNYWDPEILLPWLCNITFLLSIGLSFVFAYDSNKLVSLNDGKKWNYQESPCQQSLQCIFYMIEFRVLKKDSARVAEERLWIK